MTASVVQFSDINGVIGANTIDVTVDLLASDLLVLFSTISIGGGRSVTTTGIGAWTRYADLNPTNSSARVRIDTLTGVTGTGTVTVTVVGDETRLSLYVVRGLSTPTVFVHNLGEIAITSGMSGVNYPVGQPVRLTADQMLISLSSMSSPAAATVFPSPPTLPSVGAWTFDAAGSATQWVHALAHATSADPTAAYLAYVSRTGGSYSSTTINLILGAPAPDALLHEQSALETLTRNDSLAALDQARLDLLTKTYAQLDLGQSGLEVLTRPGSVVLLDGAALELLLQVTPALVVDSRRGWGVLM